MNINLDPISGMHIIYLVILQFFSGLFKNWIENFSRYIKIGNPIGEGTYGTVWKAKRLLNNTTMLPNAKFSCAIKLVLLTFWKGWSVPSLQWLGLGIFCFSLTLGASLRTAGLTPAPWRNHSTAHCLLLSMGPYNSLLVWIRTKPSPFFQSWPESQAEFSIHFKGILAAFPLFCEPGLCRKFARGLSGHISAS